MGDKPAVVSFRDVSMHFGGVKAIDRISFEVGEGVIYGIIGPNGAGKSTLFNVLTGVYQPTGGKVYYRDKLINSMVSHVITGNGIARTFQNIRLFDSESVLDNLKVAQFSHIQYNVMDTLLKTGKYRRQEERVETECLDVLRVLGLERFANTAAGSLPYGEQRRVEIARALCCKPDVLLLDEPAAGMNHAEVDELNGLIKHIRDAFHVTVLVVEHQMRLVMSICDEVLVMNFGQKLVQGKPIEVKSNPLVLEAYLGKAK